MSDRQLKILMIDDESDRGSNAPDGNYMWYYSAALRSTGHTVREVQTIDAALNELRTSGDTFDLVILDVMMPPGTEFAKDPDAEQGLRTGVVLAKRIKQDWPKLPIVVLTNVASRETLAALTEIESVKRLLLKPECTPFELADAISEINL